MVNESNKIQENMENEELGQRLAASNQALANMQAEHRQLLEEMEQLRKRAEDLQRIRQQQECENKEKGLQFQQNSDEATDILQTSNENGNPTKNMEKQEVEHNVEDHLEEEDYIKEKVAEIARLKAQFKRVQHMINTTELIENHFSKNQATEIQLPKVTNKPKVEPENEAKSKASSSATGINSNVDGPQLTVLPNMPTMDDLNTATTSDEKEQLILTMLNMFQDFSSDLKSQADNLRAERERIKELKESIIRSKKEEPK